MTTLKNGPGILTSTTRPPNPSVGETIFETDTTSLRYYTGSAWEGLPPVGVVEPYAGSTAPAGWLLCFGQAISRATYADLYQMVRETYGGGNGSTTFNIPDLRGRSVHGKDDMGGTAAGRVTAAGSAVNGLALGSTGGNQYTQAHGHTFSASGNTQNDDPDHGHQWTLASAGNAQGTGDLPFRGYNLWDGSFHSGGTAEWSGYGSSVPAGGYKHTHTYSFTATSNAHANTNGSGNNVPPTRVFNFMIKY